MRRLQLALVATLLAATAVFAAGAIAERSQADTHAEPAATRAHEESEGAGGEAQHSEELLGVDTESAPLIAIAAIAGLGLAAVAASSLAHRTAVLLAIALLMAVWAALDVREIAHQIDESRTGVAVLAAVAAALHLSAAALAGTLAARARRAGMGSPGRGVTAVS